MMVQEKQYGTVIFDQQQGLVEEADLQEDICPNDGSELKAGEISDQRMDIVAASNPREDDEGFMTFSALVKLCTVCGHIKGRIEVATYGGY